LPKFVVDRCFQDCRHRNVVVTFIVSNGASHNDRDVRNLSGWHITQRLFCSVFYQKFRPCDQGQGFPLLRYTTAKRNRYMLCIYSDV